MPCGDYSSDCKLLAKSQLKEINRINSPVRYNFSNIPCYCAMEKKIRFNGLGLLKRMAEEFGIDIGGMKIKQIKYPKCKTENTSK